MNLKKILFVLQDNIQRNSDTTKDFPTLADLMKEQNVSNDKANSVHYRRDLDSLG